MLAGSALFEEFKNDGKIDIPDLSLRDTFPHPSVFRPPGRKFSPHKIKLLGYAYNRIEHVVDEQRDHVFFQLNNAPKPSRPRHGTGFCPGLLEDCFTKHLIVSGDKDSSGVVMSVDLYHQVVRQNMISLRNSEAPIYHSFGGDTPNDVTSSALLMMVL